MLHGLTRLQEDVQDAYEAYDYRRVTTLLMNYINLELSAFYFDIRKDSLYCDPRSSGKRKASLYIINIIFKTIAKLYAPILSFTMDEVWKNYTLSLDKSIHLTRFELVNGDWGNANISSKWNNIRELRKTVTAALEIKRRDKEIGSSLEAGIQIYTNNREILTSVNGVDLAEICITSSFELIHKEPDSSCFILDEQPEIGVIVHIASGKKCKRSWRVTEDVGTDAEYPDLSKRDADAVREFLSMRQN